MIRARDPAGMSPEERMAEVAYILAAGYIRRISSKALDLSGSPGALSGVLNGRGDAPRKETA